MRGRLRDKISAGEHVVTVELEPPKGTGLDRVMAYARALHHHIDAVNITDCPMANVRMSPIAIASIIRRELGLDAVFHLTCRDRNVIGLQSELLGASALGVECILALTGDPPSRGDHPYARGVFELDSTGLITLAEGLNRGFDLAGGTLNHSTNFLIGAAANPSAADLSRECERLAEKVRAGAGFIQTQPVFDPETLYHFLHRVAYLNVPVIVGVLPLKSARMVRYINSNISEMRIPLGLARDIERGGRSAGVAHARRLMGELERLVGGVHLMPVGSADIALEVLGLAGLPAEVTA